jgi:hypothetical protein
MKKLLLATAAVLALSGAAKADVFLATSFSLLPGAQPVGIQNPVARTVEAGQIRLTGPTGDLDVWCLDLIDTLTVPYPFQVSVYSPGQSRPGLNPLDASQVRQIASLILNGTSLGGPDADAATQLAIWKTEYGTNFSVAGLSGSLLSQFNLVFADTQAGGSLDCTNCVLTVLSDDVIAPNQVLATAAPVPGPVVGAGLPGLLAAFGSAGLWWKRRRKA